MVNPLCRSILRNTSQNNLIDSCVRFRFPCTRTDELQRRHTHTNEPNIRTRLSFAERLFEAVRTDILTIMMRHFGLSSLRSFGRRHKRRNRPSMTSFDRHRPAEHFLNRKCRKRRRRRRRRLWRRWRRKLDEGTFASSKVSSSHFDDSRVYFISFRGFHVSTIGGWFFSDIIV